MRYIAAILAPAIVLASLATAGAAETAAPSPIKIAVFPFELEDFSAGAAYVPPDDVDREQLRLSTEEARRLIAASGRYQLVDVSAANDRAAKASKLRDCEGCEAKIAAGLGADQSMVGIVSRITRTEYAVTYKIRDAKSGSIVAVEQTDLRMGANVAWSRGARWLIQNRLLARAQDKPLIFAVAEIEYVDTSGEVIDQSADHVRRLREFEASLRNDLAASGKLRNAGLDCPPNGCSVGDLDAGQLLGKAQAAGADLLVIGSVHKMSTLVQWAKFDIIDVKARKVVFERLVSFRGDNDEAWRRAASFIVRQIREAELMRLAATALPQSP
ncbi:DUF2380 domain-containing protein [Bradyrhizobium australiense]|uniref:DUF2380 domain-containing protein n=1 Tax=Bradyrhizobium australiense TaxID=2721161 RepID=A0A7Y4LVC2_9BRAD|nr:DUF2380 domain-containing protein [Bradyrhizobium australiense]NOJ40247.1 DUF2380 domain-containing protein [Bradyrhizobium australiense]